VKRGEAVSTLGAIGTLVLVVMAAMVGIHVAFDRAAADDPGTWNPIGYAFTLLLHQKSLPAGTGFWVTLFEVGVVAIFIVTFILWGKATRRRRGGKRGRKQNSGAGFATGRELQRRVDGGHQVGSTTPYGYVDRKPVSARTEDTAGVLAPPRAGKTMRIVVRRVLSAAGPCLVTSTKADIVRLTALPRTDVGTVMVFDPEQVMSWPDPVKWDVTAGCEDSSEATRRAGAIIAARPSGNESNGGFFKEAAETVLRCLLHAAALGGKDMRDVMVWMRDFENDTPYTILRTHPKAANGWESDLRKFCRSEARETVDSTDMSVRLSLSAFANEHVLDAVCPKAGETTIDPLTFHTTTDTLYLLSESGEGSLSAPVITALVRSIEHAARKAGERTASGRLDPVLTLILDEVANVAPIPTLPSLMSDGGGRGIVTWAIAQSRSQLRDKWGKDGAETILNSAAIQLVLGGVKDTDYLEELSKLCDEREVQRTSETASQQGTSTNTSTARERVMPVARIRQLPEGEGLLLYRELPSAIISLPGWWETDSKKKCEASQAWSLAREGLLTEEASA
jgi:type IV secretory pathway TraG/TraD family ATPase VirD4